jgi:peptidoglycan-N-acetylglucosamine deacetylase
MGPSPSEDPDRLPSGRNLGQASNALTTGRALLIVASLAALALLVRSVLASPPPLGLVALAASGYLVLVLAGVLVPRLEMYGDVVCRGLTGARGVALTFDDGPDPRSTPRVLEILGRHGARGTFFVLGEKAEAHPELLVAMAEGGHAVEVHGYRHDRLLALRAPQSIARDLERTASVVEGVTGKRPRWFRPPMGHVSPRTAAAAKRGGFELVGWSVRGLDGLPGRNANAVLERVRGGLRPGAIVLLHDASERGDFVPASLDALPGILKTMAERGLESVPLHELFEAGRPEP